MEPGTRLGPYEIQAQLGAGGMGEVYLARDTRLGREVAIKVLPEEYAGDPERLARFEQEARAAAALNHPNIAVVHDIGADNGTHYMVQEYLQGETLRAALADGALSLKRTLALGCQIAEALRAAHQAGIVHRDLKPDNVFVSPEGHAKVLDFGLAKLLEAGPAAADASMSPTVIGTMAGTVMGTAGYMAPEQVNGAEVDRRADLFALGCVLYEMATGRRAFAGESLPDTLARILHSEPESPAGGAAIPPALDRILTKCLKKDPSDRYQYADDLVVDLRAVESAPVSPLDDAPRAPTAGDSVQASGLRGTGLAAALASVAILGLLLGRQFPATRAATDDRPPVRARIGLDPAGSMLTGGRPIVPPFALSPDGRTFVFAASADGETRELFLRDFAQTEAVPLRGTEGARWPFFAPDGERVAFVDGTARGSRILSVPIEGGLPTTHVEDAWPFGVSWGTDGYIYYTPDYRSGIWRVAAAGGQPERVTELQPGETSHRHARLVPGTDTLLYVVLEGPVMCRWESARIMARALGSGDRWTVLEGGADPRVLPTGHLMFNDGTVLMAIPFDAATGRTRGTAAPVLNGVMTSQCGPVPFVEYGMAMVDVAGDGTLLYLSGGLFPARRLELVAATPGGERELLSNANVILSPRVAPDGRRVLIATPDGLLLIDPERAQADLTIDDGFFGTFSPDGLSVAYMGGNTVNRRASDGTGEAEVLLEATTETYAAEWSSDDTLLLVRSEGNVARAGWGIWALDLDAGPGAAPRRLFGEEGSQSYPALSPDERWLAYTEGVDDTRVFITSYPDLTGRYLVGVGRAPSWSPDGTTLYLETGRGTALESVDVSDPRAPGVAEEFHTFSQYPSSTPVRGYDLFPDGRVVFARIPDELAAGAVAEEVNHIELFLDWFQELERVVPSNR